jgi:hypothetical protein
MTVELFSVSCTTCKARLKVRDEAAIGLILACPKCGSMVQVAPPPGWTRESVAAAALAAAPRAAQPAAQPAALPTFEVDPLIERRAAAAASSPEETSPREASAGEPPMVSPKLKGWPLFAAGCAAGVLVGLAIWAAAMWLLGGSAPARAEGGRRKADATRVAKKPPTEGSAPKRATEVSKPGEKATPPLPDPSAEPAEPMPPSEPAKAPPTEGEQNDGAPAAKSQAPSAADPPQEPETVPPMDPADPSPDEPPTDELEGSASREAIERRLAEPLSGVRFDNQKLSQFAAFISQMAAVAVVFDEPALARLGKGPKTQIDLRLRDTTAGDALRAALSPHGLTYEIREGQLVITAVKPAGK